MSTTVLLVEDNAVNARLATTLLGARGWATVHHKDARSALDWLNDNHVDVALLDIQMPGMDGEALCRHLRGNPRFATLPLIAVTAHAMVGDEQRFLRGGFDAYLSKPYRYNDLYSVIETCLLSRTAFSGTDDE